MRWVVALSEARDERRFGRKAAQLAGLSQLAGVRVPEGVALDASAFEEAVEAMLAPAQRPGRVLRGDPSARSPARLASIRGTIERAALPEAVRAEVVSAWEAMGRPAVAVRSSGLHEDGEAASAAGQQETVLGVRDAEGLERAVLRCWASLYAERSAVYLRQHGDGGRLAMAVVVQRLVDATTAGVIFTADPVEGDRGIAVVEAAWGLGCGVVDGEIGPDVLRVDRASGRVLASRIGDKAVAVRPGPDGGVVREPVAEGLRRERCLDDAGLAELLEVARVIEASAGAPRDIEWAFDGAGLWALQARPIVGMGATRNGAAAPADDRSRWVWSNVNVGEALPGVATPLTWSIAAAFSDKGFRRAFAALGCRVDPGTELVGRFHGRIYLNLTNFMRIARQVPVFSPRMFIEFGGGGGAELIEQQVAPGRWGPFLLRAPEAGVRWLSENLGLDARLRAFEDEFSRSRMTLGAMELRGISQLGLRDLVRSYMGLLDRTGELMLTCASGYLASIVGMKGFLHATVQAESERFERELLAGFSDLESAAPGIALFHIAEIARGDLTAREALLGRDPATLRLAELPEGPTRRAFESFLRAYGYRCPREAELSTPRWREDPSSLFAAVRAWLQRVDERAIARVERQHQLRARAEADLESALPAVTRAAARHLIARTQRFARLRERMRARVTESLGFLRTLALEAGRRMHERERGCPTDAAFYLTVDELQGWLGGEIAEVSGLVATRRAQVLRDQGRPDPPSLFVGSPPAVSPLPIAEGDRWTGVAASPGVVTGAVRVLRDPAEGALLQPGEVLVTPVADVGWTPLFLVAAGVVTELGGALSHASLVAREYGVPAVVNVPGATRALRTGDRVRVDGERGVVERLSD